MTVKEYLVKYWVKLPNSTTSHIRRVILPATCKDEAEFFMTMAKLTNVYRSIKVINIHLLPPRECKYSPSVREKIYQQHRAVFGNFEGYLELQNRKEFNDDKRRNFS